MTPRQELDYWEQELRSAVADLAHADEHLLLGEAILARQRIATARYVLAIHAPLV